MSRNKLDGMVIDSFGAEGVTKGTVVFLNGFPGAIGPLPAVLSAVGNGYDVIAPQYPGTYDSEGEHTLCGTTIALIDLFKWLDANQEFETAKGIKVIAHSFGAFHLMNVLRKSPALNISKLLLLAPVLTYQKTPDSGIREELMPHLRGVIESRPYTYRIGGMSEWEQAASGRALFKRSGDWLGDVFIGFGTDDDTFESGVFEHQAGRTIQQLLGCQNTLIEVVDNAGHGMHELLPHLGFMDKFYDHN